MGNLTREHKSPNNKVMILPQVSRKLLHLLKACGTKRLYALKPVVACGCGEL